MKERRLNRPGEGEYIYDYANDVLLFKIKNREYRESIEVGNVVIDIDSEDFVTGIQVMDASRVLRIPKYALRHVRGFTFSSTIEDSTVMVQLNFNCLLRNKVLVSKGQDILREAPFAVATPHVVSATI